MIEIYKNWELLTMSPVFTSFIWRRRFSRSGEFQFVTDFNKDIWEYFEPMILDRQGNIIKQGNIVYKRDTNEAAFIESRQKFDTFAGGQVMIIRGRFLSSLLDRRIVTLEGNFTLQNLLNNIINNNFLAAAGSLRSMAPAVRLLPFTLPGINIFAEYRSRNAYDIITDLLNQHFIGVRTIKNFNTRSFDIEFYMPAETDTVFNKEFNNILEQDYYEDTKQYRNVVYIDERDGGGFIHNNTAFTGFNRREMGTAAPREGSHTLTQTAIDALTQNSAVRTLTSVINPYNYQFEYLKDWDIGSVVLSESAALQYSEREIITEISEHYDQSGLNIEVSTGSYIDRRSRR